MLGADGSGSWELASPARLACGALIGAPSASFCAPDTTMRSPALRPSSTG